MSGPIDRLRAALEAAAGDTAVVATADLAALLDAHDAATQIARAGRRFAPLVGETMGEHRVLRVLMEAAPGAYVRDVEIAVASAGGGAPGASNVAQVMVCRLRQRIRRHLGHQMAIQRSYGGGYRLTPAAAAALRTLEAAR